MHRRTALKSLLATLAAATASGTALAAAGQPASRSPQGIIRPKRLASGQTIGLIAPASNVFEDEETRFAIDVVRSLGFDVREGQHLHAKSQYLAGSDADRAADVNAMFADESVDAIFCLRGGYGTPRILPYLDYELIRQNPKVLLGYSDITALLNAISAKSRLVTFHGPIAKQNFSDYTLSEYRKVLVRPEKHALIGSPPPFHPAPGRVEQKNRITRFNGGTARGQLVGGNLTLICATIGTPFEPDFRGALLFLEDDGEAPYRIDRMLTQLWLAGKLDEIAGVVFGKFTGASKFDGNSFSIEEVIQQRFGPMGVPCIRGLMIGHVSDQTVVPIGAEAILDADAGTLRLTGPAVL
ncbi:MAG: S66 peptidase family protein [Parvularcula sp.]